MPARDRTALYARVSTNDQNPENQLEELRAVAAARGWSVVGEYVDQGESGRKESRPRLNDLLAEVRQGRITRVVVWKYDRFGRSVVQLVTALADFRTRNVEFVSLRDGMDTSTPMGRFAFHQFAAIAEFESAMIAERTKAGIARARRNGTQLGRRRAITTGEVARFYEENGKPSVRQMAKALGVGVATIQRRMGDARKRNLVES